MAMLIDLMKTKDRAELIGGEIVFLDYCGYLPSRVCTNAMIALDEYAQTTASGEVFGGKLVHGLTQPLKSGRESFCPFGSFHTEPWPDNPMSYIPSAPTFAIEL